jgi:DNA polymerase
MFHPAAALHQQSLKRVIEEDIKAIPSLLKEAMESKEPAAPPPQQLSMF